MPLEPARREELSDWLRLIHTPGVGPVTARTLLAALGLPGDVLSAGHAALSRTAGERIARAVRAPDERRDAQAAAALAWAEAPGHHLVTLADAAYPPQLLQIGDPPPVLYVTGRPESLLRPMVAVVGSRNATVIGQSNARAFARVLSEAGFAVVSGLALGIDAAAHEGALEGRGGTVAVVGTGIDRVYPAAHAPLARGITADGALLSELALGTRASTSGFPRRNRLIAGLARAVLVVEAAVHSGSLITARQAAEFGRDVFAIPGSIHSPLARGCHALIKQGAKLVESAEDILSELGAVEVSARTPDRRDTAVESTPLFEAIGHDPVLPDMLAERLGMPVAEVNAGLLGLELDGAVLRLADGRVQRAWPGDRLATAPKRLL
jgi:DNA processing protein